VAQPGSRVSHGNGDWNPDRPGTDALKKADAQAPPSARPFLKWAGGKRQLLASLRRYYPAAFERYHEPFLGSGAVFFDLCRHGRLERCTATLVDVNPDLIGCYRAIRDAVDEVIDHLSRLEREHRADGEAHYYEVRDRRFNPARLQLLAEDPQLAPYPPSLAAMLIYLNRTGYNGLFRVNARGAFNVPVGRYANPRICDRETLESVSAVLRQPGVTLKLGAFDGGPPDAGPGDFYYVDPPYAPLSATARFTAYTAGGFTLDDQRRLQATIVGLATRGAKVLVSNSTAREILRLYTSDEARAVGLRVVQVPARRAINSRAAGRGPIRECIVTNVTPTQPG
jgi:DNA adenine methylase